MKYIYHEPSDYGFRDRNGHHGKFFGTTSPRTNHLIVECDDKLTAALIQHKSGFNYYIIEGIGYFIFDDERQIVHSGDPVVVPPGTQYSFEGHLKKLLINTPTWDPSQEEVITGAK